MNELSPTGKYHGSMIQYFEEAIENHLNVAQYHDALASCNCHIICSKKGNCILNKITIAFSEILKVKQVANETEEP